MHIVGLAELRKELRRLDDPRGWAKELTAVHRRLARTGLSWVQAEAESMGGPYARFAAGLSARGRAAGAAISVSRKVAGRNGKAFIPNGVFYGSKQFPQFDRWVGNSWDVGVAGQGPYAINPAIAAHMGDIIDTYAAGIDDLTARAFPD